MISGFRNILVTDSHKLAGFGAIRSLGRAGYSVLAGYPQGQGRPSGKWSRYWSREIRYPHPRLHQFEFRQWLRDEAARGIFDAVLPVSEASLVAVAAIRKEAPQLFTAILPDDACLQYSLSKFRATSLALSVGLTCPRTVFVSSGAGQWNDDLSGLRFPIVIKTDNFLTTSGTYDPGHTFFAATSETAHDILRRLKVQGRTIIAQEVISGPGTGAFLLRFDGAVRLSFAHRRIHEVPYTGGASSFRESIRDDELVELSARMLDAMNYNGVAMLEFKRSAGDGRSYFLEVNGRLWGSLALALHCGVDFPRALVDCYAFGAPKPVRSGYPTKIRCRNIFVGELAHLGSILRTNGHRPGDRPSKIAALAKFVLLSLDPTIRHDYFWWSDPLPGFAQAFSTIGRLAKWPLRRLRDYRNRRRIRRLVAEHHRRMARPHYFPDALTNILFLCYGNTYRSPFAAKLWNAKAAATAAPMPHAISAGFHPKENRESPRLMIALAAEYKVDLSTHRSRTATAAMIDSADAIFVMDLRNYDDLRKRFPAALQKTYFLGMFAGDHDAEIQDPVSMEHARAHHCYRTIKQSIDSLFERLLEDERSKAARVHAPQRIVERDGERPHAFPQAPISR